MLPERTNYLYYVALISSALGFICLVTGVFWPAWFVLSDDDARTMEVFHLFDDHLVCTDNFCVNAAGSMVYSTGTGWLLVVQALLLFNVIFLFMGVVMQLNHAICVDKQDDLFMSCLVLLATSLFITTVVTILLAVKTRVLTAYTPPDHIAVLRIQSTPLVVMLFSVPCVIVSIALFIHGTVTSRQKKPQRDDRHYFMVQSMLA